MKSIPYLFANNDTGFPHFSGKACLIYFVDLQSLCLHIRNLACLLSDKPLTDIQFEFTPVSLTDDSSSPNMNFQYTYSNSIKLVIGNTSLNKSYICQNQTDDICLTINLFALLHSHKKRMDKWLPYDM